MNLSWNEGHADDTGNLLADTLAGEGSSTECETESRTLFPSEWGRGNLRRNA